MKPYIKIRTTALQLCIKCITPTTPNTCASCIERQVIIRGTRLITDDTWHYDIYQRGNTR